MAESKMTAHAKFMEKLASIAVVVFVVLHLYSMGMGIVHTLGEIVLPTVVEELAPKQVAASSLDIMKWSQEKPNLPISPRPLQETTYWTDRAGLEHRERATVTKGIIPILGGSDYVGVEVVNQESPSEVY
jgi:hypothetical protein